MKGVRRLLAAMMAAGVLMLAGVASAHVSVLPKQSTVNGFERYTIRVPNEKDIATTNVSVELPAGTTFSSVLPVAGWQFTTEKDAAGKVVALAWSGGEIKKGEFFEFGISVRNPKEPGTVLWKAHQTYSDGTVVDWVGEAGADKPAPTVKLEVASAPADSHESSAKPEAAPPTNPAVAPVQSAAEPSALPVWLSGAALICSVGVLFVALRRR